MRGRPCNAPARQLRRLRFPSFLSLGRSSSSFPVILSRMYHHCTTSALSHTTASMPLRRERYALTRSRRFSLPLAKQLPFLSPRLVHSSRCNLYVAVKVASEHRLRPSRAIALGNCPILRCGSRKIFRQLRGRVTSSGKLRDRGRRNKEESRATRRSRLDLAHL